MVALVLHVGRASNWKTNTKHCKLSYNNESVRVGEVEKASLVEILAFLCRVHKLSSKQKYRKEPAPREFFGSDRNIIIDLSKAMKSYWSAMRLKSRRAGNGTINCPTTLRLSGLVKARRNLSKYLAHSYEIRKAIECKIWQNKIRPYLLVFIISKVNWKNTPLGLAMCTKDNLFRNARFFQRSTSIKPLEI